MYNSLSLNKITGMIMMSTMVRLMMAMNVNMTMIPMIMIMVIIVSNYDASQCFFSVVFSLRIVCIRAVRVFCICSVRVSLVNYRLFRHTSHTHTPSHEGENERMVIEIDRDTRR